MPFDVEASMSPAVSTAKTPEEMYKVFAAAATQHIGNAIASALAEAIGATSKIAAQSANPAILGWENFIKGISMDLCWGTPGHMLPPTVLNTFSIGTVNDPNSPLHMKGVSVSIGITGTF